MSVTTCRTDRMSLTTSTRTPSRRSISEPQRGSLHRSPLTLLGNSGPERDVHRLDDIVGAVRLSDDDLDDIGGSHRGLERLLVSRGQDPQSVLSEVVSFINRRKFQWAS